MDPADDRRSETTNMRTRQFVLIAFASLVLLASHASAQTASTQPPDDRWEGQVVPYLWGLSIKGPVGIGNRTADVDASFSNILDHLHFAAMGLGEAQHRRLIIVADTLYSDVRDQRATPGPLFSSVDPQQRLFLMTPEGGYRLLDTDDTSLDVLGGIRYWHLSSELQFQPGLLPGINLQESRSWVDAIVAVRAKRTLAHVWWASGYGDVGKGGSTSTYQLIGNVGRDLGERYAVVLAYRYLKVNYDTGGFLFNPALKGPLFAFAFKL
jgi:hypothetical protein